MYYFFNFGIYFIFKFCKVNKLNIIILYNTNKLRYIYLGTIGLKMLLC